VSAGDTILRFDITLGDALFVDRLSYHFKRPEAGDPFVFRTGEIPGIEGGAENIVDKYYIKRIGGVAGERLEIKNGALLVNGKPRSEVEAFQRNERQEGDYKGYVYPTQNDPSNPPQLLTAPGVTVELPTGTFVALGDNSANSLDSRYWGYVPEKSVIGKAIFIYYPFTKRWGLAE
jgi:signal peptidase I